MNILFVNYGDFTTNSLNHIGGFANTLCAIGHACVVAVPQGREGSAHLPQVLFIPATYAEALQSAGIFPNGRGADIIHAWTPREGVRKFVVEYQRLLATPARVIVHLEDNEQFLLEAYTGKPFEELRNSSPAEIDGWLVDALSHPLRSESFLRVADGITHITAGLREFAPPDIPTQLLPPGVDFSLYQPQPPDEKLRAELGLPAGEKLIVFTGSNTFANEPEMRELYLAIAVLNQRGCPTRLVRTGFNSPRFLAGLSPEITRHVIDLGFVEKARLPRLLALADVLVQPGHAGPFNDYRLPSKLPEFLAMGRPVILPNANVAGQMQDGREAVFLHTGSPDEIAATCQRLFANPALGETLARNAVAFARQHFDPTANTRLLENFYARVAASPHRVDWTQLRQSAGSETRLIAFRAQHHEPRDREREHLALLCRQLDAEVQKWHHLDELCRAKEQHIKNLQEGLKLTQDHANNLDRMLVDLRPRFETAEALRLRAETLLQATRRQCHAFEQEIEHVEALWQQRLSESETKLRQQLSESETRLGQQLSQAETNFRQSDREARYYKKLLQQQYAESQGFNEAARLIHDALKAKTGELARKDEKLRRIQGSFSWQATAWLRLLRRKLLDPLLRPPATPVANGEAEVRLPTALPTGAPPSFRYSVDYPQTWSFPPKKLLVRGWCFATEPIRFTQLRATINGARRYPGVFGLKRLDVFASMRDFPQAEYCGWKVEIPLQREDHELVLEVGDEEGGWHVFFTTALRVGDDTGPAELTSYERWTEAFDRHTPDSLAALAKEEMVFTTKPLISVIMPVYNTPERWLVKAVQSVQAQVYPNWELCLADDASPQPHVRPLLEKFAAADPRIKITFREKNGHISAASNSALQLATGDFVALLDHDDELSPHALHEVVALLNTHPETDVIYSDEDKIDEEGHRHEPYFKPDWLPDLFHGQNYLSHLTVYRAALVRDAGGFRAGYEGSQDWDLALRVIGRLQDCGRIRHIPKVLYHWRAIPGSTALMLSEKNYPLEAARRALTDYFSARGEKIALHHVPGDHWRVQYALPAEPPLVSLIIPTRNGLRFLQRGIESILEKTTYPNYEIIVVDNGSDDPAALAYLDSLAQGANPLLASVVADAARATEGPLHRAVRVLRYDAPFNFSAINNFAVAQATGELVGLLNNDLEVITPSWLEEMASQALRPGIGCVGALLYYPNDTVQHAGVIVGLGGVAGHAFRDNARGSEGKFNRGRLAQNYSAVTAACLVVRRKIYQEVGGLDETHLTIAFNDVDFCLKVQAAGYRNLWTPFAELYHHESVSRGAEDTPEKHERFRREVEIMLQRWPAVIRHDPAYNPNLTLEHTDFSLAAPPRPWLP